MFDTVLVANRGEIAVRVIRTLRAMGLRSAAVYSDADAGSPHVAAADVAVRLGPAPAAYSYLDIEAILSACRAVGAQAVHPGYGFLSENVDFARALQTAGITFIGPPVHAINLMGDKIRAKNHVTAHQVPTTPGIAEPGLDDAALAAAAAGVGYPLLIKPSAGGGGKGMVEVRSPEDLPEALASARRTAAAAFGDDTLFLERLVPSPRHIEVQILADAHGTVLHLGERECSLQRRHQKVIEEAPSPLVDAALRSRLGAAAVAAAASVGYVGAGTVEFLLSDANPDEFYFMEMNTRLQVEHPVTEQVVRVRGERLDLVAWQVRIAAGQPLDFGQEEVGWQGHAIEARLYAEDPAAGFLPSIGTVGKLRLPGHVRVDAALREGQQISPHYDPMLAKVIADGPDRPAALRALDRALADTVVLGVKTNIEYLRLLLADPDVAAGNLDTTLIERRSFEFRRISAAELALAAHLLSPAPGTGPWAADGWRPGAPAPRRLQLEADGELVEVDLAAGAALVDGEPHRLLDTPNGVQVDGQLARISWAREGDTLWLGSAGWSTAVRRRGRREQVPEAAGAAGISPHVSSPMPGTVIAVKAADGDAVTAGQVLLIVEAMKMEHQLASPADGIVRMPALKPGDLVTTKQTLATIEPSTDDGHTRKDQHG
ncbi:ATP-binding protein [Glutamicibacter protophormiae]|uniref:ATP-binding protein n=1 Tax=Glutamicibacter protophormiae TaxID=37930 RepID=UPI0023B87FB5|nr:biotin carboxylase N-terminal domain-containing protein [Glutamicibacter protophormiae]